MEEFKDKNIGKRLPYTVPLGFFESVTQQTLERARQEAVTSPVQSKSMVMWRVLSAAASLALLLTFAYIWQTKEDRQTPESKVATSTQTPIILPEKNPVLQKEPQTVIEQELKPESQTLAKAPSKSTNKTEAPILVTKEKQEESLDDLLASLSDQELSQLANIAESETTALEETTLK